MRCCSRIVAPIAVLIAAGCGGTTEVSRPEPSDPLKALVEVLRSDDMAARERANNELIRIGLDRLEDLRRLEREEKDTEARERLLRAISRLSRTTICSGSRPCLSPDGRFLAFTRWGEDEGKHFRGRPSPDIPMSPQIWIRDMNDDAEHRLCHGDWAVAWVGPRALASQWRKVLDPETGRSVEGIAQVPAGLMVEEIQRSPGGRSLAYLVDYDFYQMNPQQVPPAPIKPTLYVVDAAGNIKALPFPGKAADYSACLYWSPDGERLAFDLLFMGEGCLPYRRTGVLHVASGRISFLGAGWDPLNSALNAMRWRTSQVWDADSSKFVFLRGEEARGNDVYLALADGSGVRPLTNDTASKWCPTLSADGQQLAYCEADEDSEGRLTQGRIRIVDLATGESRRIAPDMEGLPGNVVWMPDGFRIIYDWSDPRGTSTILQAVVRRP